MSFVSPEAYDRFMGVYSVQLAPQLVDFAGVAAGQRALDVGCGPGSLTGILVDRLGPAAVGAVDPSEPFVAAVRQRYPGVDARQGSAEALPLEDASVDVALAQLVVHFMSDPVAGLREMCRVTRPGGVVAASVWDFGDGRSPLTPFWRAATELDRSVEGEASRPGTSAGALPALLREAGLRAVEDAEQAARVAYETFDDWWAPFTSGVGPAGAYAASLDDERLAALRDRCRSALGGGPFTLEAYAWAARGVVPT